MSLSRWTSRGFGVGALAAGVWATACFSPVYRDCQVTCENASGCPAPLTCQQGFCRPAGAAGLCEPSDGGADRDAGFDEVPDLDSVDVAPPAIDAAGTGDPDDAGGGDLRMDQSEAGPDASPGIISLWEDAQSSWVLDRVAGTDDGLQPGDGPDLVFGAAVMGPIDALVLVSGGQAAGVPSDPETAWDTLIGSAAFAPDLRVPYQSGRDTPVLGVSIDGDSLDNQRDGSIPAIPAGLHRLKLFANGRAAVFEPRTYVRLAALSAGLVFWSPPLEPSWAHPSIDAFSISPGSGSVDLVAGADAAPEPGDGPDFVFDLDFTGPIDTLFLAAVPSVPLSPPEALEYVWDTVPGNDLLPAGSVSKFYQRGESTWTLGLGDARGALLNLRDGSLPRVIGHFSGRLFANATPDAPGTTYLFQLVAAIGNIRLFSQVVPWHN